MAEHHNFIADMVGPEFVVFYLVFSAVVLVIAYGVLSSAEHSLTETRSKMLPDENDPYLFAYLYGGAPHVVRTAVLSLVQRGYLKHTQETKSGLKKFLSGPPKDFFERETNPPSLSYLNHPIERVIWESFPPRFQPRDLFADLQMKRASEQACSRYEDELERAGLLAPKELNSLRWRIGLIGVALILVLGGYKLGVALDRGKTNVMFLIIIAIASLPAMAKVCSRGRLSKVGREYFRYTQLKHNNLKSHAATSTVGGGSDLLFACALFGTCVLAGTTYGYFNDLFKRASRSSRGCGAWVGGCGSSCGSSCGGGGGCGGGCGGCGGG